MGLAITIKYTPYERHPPEETDLYKLILNNLDHFLYNVTQKSGPLLPYVEKEFNAYLSCGILQKGFARFCCEDCKHEVLVPFSCKTRGFCPRCGARRMVETAANLVDYVIPKVDVRQWVITLPQKLRYWVAHDRKLLNKTLQIIQRAISSFYKAKAKRVGVVEPETGTVVFIQRSGDAINLNPHFHCIQVDGVYGKTSNKCRSKKFIPIADLTSEEVAGLTETIAKRVIKMLRRTGLLNEPEQEDAQEYPDKLATESSTQAACTSASIVHRLAFSEPPGKRVERIGYGFGPEGEKAVLSAPLCAQANGFSVHAATEVKAKQRSKLERLLRYVARSPISLSRMSINENGNVIYSLKRRWSDGTEAILLKPLEMIEKIAAIIPPPAGHLIRYFGVFAPNSSLRKEIIPNSAKVLKKQKGESGLSLAQRRSLAELLKRSFNIDFDVCPKCSGKVRLVASILERKAITAILNHIGFSTEPPRSSAARSPPAELSYEAIYD